MNLTLETVRNVLGKTLGYQSFTASFIKKVVADERFPTACINHEGTLGYNKPFVEKYVSCPEDLFCLIFHELLHPAFQHFIYENGNLENIAADAIINACISTIYMQQSKKGNLFRKLYKDQGIEAILRPVSKVHHSNFDKLYTSLYYRVPNNTLSTGEVILTLRILADAKQVQNIVLIGSHGQDPEKSSQQFPKDVTSNIASDITNSLESIQHAGFSQIVLSLLKEALKSKVSIRTSLLMEYATRKKLDNFHKTFQQPQNMISPIPIYPSKRDLVLLSAGIWPGYFRNKVVFDQTQHQGIAIYLDVSGSVDRYLPEIIGILQHLRRDIRSIYQFSNVVVETDFETLMQGHIETSFGTDFDCVADSLLKHNYDKAIVITDGYASMEPEQQKTLSDKHVKILTILYGGGRTCEDLAPFGPVVKLSDVTV